MNWEIGRLGDGGRRDACFFRPGVPSAACAEEAGGSLPRFLPASPPRSTWFWVWKLVREFFLLLAALRGPEEVGTVKPATSPCSLLRGVGRVNLLLGPSTHQPKSY